jgi:hypothetical protein
MKKLLLTITILLAFTSGAVAIERGITPYGDYCPKCSTYGICRKQLSRREAVTAIRAYFKNKGLTIGNIRGRGRFIKVDIFRHGKLVDRIIFDRRTGRLRSIY